MYKCLDCGKIFSEEDIKKEYTTYGDFYGLENASGNDTSITIWHCPKCYSEDIEGYEEEEEE